MNDYISLFYLCAIRMNVYSSSVFEKMTNSFIFNVLFSAVCLFGPNVGNSTVFLSLYLVDNV